MVGSPTALFCMHEYFAVQYWSHCMFRLRTKKEANMAMPTTVGRGAGIAGRCQSKYARDSRVRSEAESSSLAHFHNLGKPLIPEPVRVHYG